MALEGPAEQHVSPGRRPVLLGWTFEAAGPEYGGYINAYCDGKPVAGLMYNDPQWNSPDGWTTYLHTTDAKAT